MVSATVCMYRCFNPGTTKHIDAALLLRIRCMKWLQSYCVKRIVRTVTWKSKLLLISTNSHFHPATPTKKRIQQTLFHRSKAFKKKLTSSWTTKKVSFFLAQQNLGIYLPVHQPISPVNPSTHRLVQASASALRSSTEPVSVAPAMPTMAITCLMKSWVSLLNNCLNDYI